MVAAGNGEWGRLGTGDLADRNVPAAVDDIVSRAVLSAGGGEHSLALQNDGIAWAWGSNSYGQLGDGTVGGSSLTPTPVEEAPGVNLGHVVGLSAGALHSLALGDDGIVRAWGRNDQYQLGIGELAPVYEPHPVEVQQLAGAIAVAAGARHSLAVLADGTVWAWGRNAEGQLGTGSPSGPVAAPVPVVVAATGLPLAGAVAVAAGDKHSLALGADGTVWAWGDNQLGQVGQGFFSAPATPSLPAARPVLLGIGPPEAQLPGVRAIACGANHSLALRTDGADAGTAWSWGHNVQGQLGTNSFAPSALAVQVVGELGVDFLADVVAVAAGGEHSLALLTRGRAMAWGYNLYGQLGIGNFDTFRTPEPVADFDALPPDQGNTLLALRQALDVSLTWPDAAGKASKWAVYRDVAKEDVGLTSITAALFDTAYVDRNVVPSPPQPPLYYYALRGLSPFCERPGP
jgi:alpha-tubulin suppressor-like RCC1 family protein